MSFKAPFVASIDNGTSSTRFIVFDRQGSIVCSSQKEYTQYYPQAGWAEHDPEQILDKTLECVDDCANEFKNLNLNWKDIKAIGITNQRETTCVWSRRTGKPIHNALVWLDTRTRDLVQELIQKTPSKSQYEFQSVCGLPISTYFSAVKLRWLMDQVAEVKQAVQEDDLMFGTVDSWLVYKLVGIHITDVTNASRTMLMNLKTLDWDPSMLSFFGIPKSILPQIKSCSEVFGYVKDGLLEGIPISGILGDQQAALVGHLCLHPGQLKNTYGTGCFMLCNTGNTPVISTHGLLTTVGYQLGPEQPCVYALEGSVAIAGASVKWLRDNMGIINSAKEVGEFAAKVTDTGGVYFVPAFSGLFAPHWRDDARGTIVGMTQFTTKDHLCRATLEAVAYQTKDIMDSMAIDTQTPITLLRVDGGMTTSKELLQIQADIAGVELHRPEMAEVTALGAALAAGHAIGIWKDLNELHSDDKIATFVPQITEDQRKEMHLGWKRALEKSINWVQ